MSPFPMLFRKLEFMQLTRHVPKQKRTVTSLLFWTSLILVVYQVLHLIDHIAQYVQRYVFGIWPAPALFEGILDASDTEVHLWLNGIEYAGFLLLWALYRRAGFEQNHHIQSHRGKAITLRLLKYILLFLVVFQTFHVADHIVQWYQLFVLGRDSPPGIFQGLFNESDTVVHLWVNGILIFGVFLVFWNAHRLKLWKLGNGMALGALTLLGVLAVISYFSTFSHWYFSP